MHTVTREEALCTEDDIYLLKEKHAGNKKLFRIFWYIIIAIALIFPFLPSKYKPHNAMVDIMSYPMAIVYIIGVFAIVMAWNYYFLIHRVKKDITAGKKIILTSYISKQTESKYKGRMSYFITVAGVPYSLARNLVSLNEYRKYKVNDRVVVEYGKYSNQLLNMRKV